MDVEEEDGCGREDEIPAANFLSRHHNYAQSTNENAFLSMLRRYHSGQMSHQSVKSIADDEDWIWHTMINETTQSH